MRRFLALLAAACMIGAALFVRSRLDAREAGPERGPLTGSVVCLAEARAACDAVAKANPGVRVRVESLETTMNELLAPDARADTAGLDAWLVPRPFVGMVEEARARAAMAPVLGDPGPVVARSPLVLVVNQERYARLTCPGEVTWSCIGDASGTPWSTHGGRVEWGAVKPGHPSPATDPTGLLVLAQATGQRLGRPDFASNDLADPAYQAWLDQLERGIPTFTPSAGSALREMATTGSATFDAAGGLEAVAGPSITTSRYSGSLSILYPSPMVTADLVAVPLVGDPAGERIAEVLRDDDARRALAGAGWRVDGEGAATGVRSDLALPSGDGLPRPGVLEALQDLWRDVIQ